MMVFSKYLNESSFVLLDKLASQYGNYAVYDDKFGYFPKNDDLDFMFQLFNRQSYKNKLHKIPILNIYPGELKQRYARKNVSGNVDAVANDYGAYISEIQFFIDNYTNEYVCSIQDECIYLNASNGSGALLATATIVCHEMAHQYDAWFGEYTELILDEQLHHKQYDPHTTKTFKLLSNQISNQGIDIMQKVDGLTFKQFSDNIVTKAKDLHENTLDPKKYTKMFDIVVAAR